MQQETNLDNVPTKQNSMKASIRQQKHLAQKSHSEITVNDLSVELKRSVEVACEKGASCWLTAIPLEQHGFTLHKSAFRDALCLNGVEVMSQIRLAPVQPPRHMSMWI